MISILNNIQDDICKYAEAIRGITGADVEIVDEFLIRVAGTGKYRHQLNINVRNQGYIYQHAMQYKKTILVDNPREHILCQGCEKREFCTEKLDLTTPIFFKNRVIGVISIICSTEQQKEMLLSQYEKFIRFIEQISDFISGKVFEYTEKLRAQEITYALRSLIEEMERGVIAITSDNIIWHANLSANRLLNSEESIIGKQITLERSGEHIYDYDVGYLILDDKSLHVLYKKVTLSSLDGESKNMIIFQDAQEFIPDTSYNNHEQSNEVKLAGRSPCMLELQHNIHKVANSHASVLVYGETGVGKEVVALTIHKNSTRKNNVFVTINCAAIPEQLLESELFGYVKGAFSGADPKGRMGKFELAHGGTLFLDEIGDMPLHLQAKLLRVLQERTISRIGSNNTIKIDVRIIAATNKNLIELIEQNLFRQDLYYRLNVVPLFIPPLRQRKEDLIDLVHYFIEEFSTQYKIPVIKLPDNIINHFYLYDWPGNVRELRNIIEYMLVMKGSSQQFNESHLPPNFLNTRRSGHLESSTFHQPNASLKKIDQQLKKELLHNALQKYGWDLVGKKKAANALGISIATLYRQIKQFELE